MDAPVRDTRSMHDRSKQRPEKFGCIIAGGGTGGHIFPALAIAHALKKIQPDLRVLFVGAKGKMEMEKVPQAGFQIEGIDIAGFNRSSLIKNLGLPWKLIRSFFQVRQIFRVFKPDAVIGVGGYSSFPVLRFAQSKGIATFIHESNAFAGKANMLLGRNATRIFVASTGMEKFFPAKKIQVTGNPVRSSIVNDNISRNEAVQSFGLDPSRKTILVIGGSLGAKSINEAIDAGLGILQDNKLQLIWQTGKPYAAKAKRAAEGLEHIWVGDFITQMELAFAAADVVVSRAGAMTIAELCVVGKPVIFVPYPFAAEDHQTANAMNLVDRKAGILVKDDLAKQSLVHEIVSLAGDPDRQDMFKNNIKKLAIVDADVVIASEILKTIHD